MYKTVLITGVHGVGWGGGGSTAMRDNSPCAAGSNQFANLDCAAFYDRSEFRRSAQCALGIYIRIRTFKGFRTSAPFLIST